MEEATGVTNTEPGRARGAGQPTQAALQVEGPSLMHRVPRGEATVETTHMNDGRHKSRSESSIFLLLEALEGQPAQATNVPHPAL